MSWFHSHFGYFWRNPCLVPSDAPTIEPMDDDHRQSEDFQAAVEELSAELEAAFPDPVDVFEDDLARQLGLRRHPALAQDEWRRVRVRYIESLTPDDM